ncbi:class I SAM-dependent methyltransferase [Nocardia takedensis]
MSTDTTVDPYARSAEFYDVMAAPHWEAKREFLLAALRGAGPITDPLLDIGAGSGLSTVTLVDSVAAVPIHAVEPSAAMRAALVSRLLAHPSAATRVTVHAEGIDDVRLPDRLGAVAMMGVVGYLEPEVRQRLWANLRERLTPRSPVIVEFMALSAPVEVPEFTIAQRRIGTRAVEVRIGGRPAAADAQQWRMRYVVREHDEIVRDFTAEHLWRTIGVEILAREAAAHEMTCEQVSPIIAVLRPAGG